MVPAISLRRYSAYRVKKQSQTGENVLPAVEISQECVVRTHIPQFRLGGREIFVREPKAALPIRIALVVLRILPHLLPRAILAP